MQLMNTVKCNIPKVWADVCDIIRAIPTDLLGEVGQIEKRQNGVWTITAKSSFLYEILLDGGLTIDGQLVKCYDINEHIRPKSEVKLTNVPYQVSENDLKEELQAYGDLVKVCKNTYP